MGISARGSESSVERDGGGGKTDLLGRQPGPPATLPRDQRRWRRLESGATLGRVAKEVGERAEARETCWAYAWCVL